MPALQWKLEDGVAVVTLDTPNAAVNVISQAVKQELLAALDTLEHDAAVRAIAFFSGKRDNFIAGADIDEFVRTLERYEAGEMTADQWRSAMLSPKIVASNTPGNRPMVEMSTKVPTGIGVRPAM